MRTHFSPDQRPTLEEAIQTFCTRTLVIPDYRPATQSSYSRALQEFRRLCADVVYADQLDLASVRRFDQELERRQLRASSRHVKIAAVKSFFAYLEQQGALSTAIAQSIAVPRQERTAPGRPLDVDDAALFMRAVRQEQQPRDIAVVTVLLRTGIALGELTELTLADLDPALPRAGGAGIERDAGSTAPAAGGWLRVRSRRASESQHIPLDHVAWEALNAYLAVRPSGPCPQLFLTTSAKPLTLDAALNLVKRYARAAGMPWVRSRSVRSGFALRQLAAGTPLLELQRRIGHRRITTTRRYTGLLSSSPRGASAHRRTCGVLIVDERAAARRQLRLLLEDAKHQVFETPDAVSARDMLRLSRFSLVVLLHLRAPTWDGAEFLSELQRDRALFADHRVIVIVSGDDSLPKHMRDSLVACDIPIIARSLNLHLLLVKIQRAYVELGANGPEVERMGARRLGYMGVEGGNNQADAARRH